MTASQMKFLLTIIEFALTDLDVQCDGHLSIFQCDVCRYKLSARLFFQSSTYLKYLTMLGIDYWLSPHVFAKLENYQTIKDLLL